jgi:hypothetical protein
VVDANLFDTARTSGGIYRSGAWSVGSGATASAAASPDSTIGNRYGDFRRAISFRWRGGNLRRHQHHRSGRR